MSFFTPQKLNEPLPTSQSTADAIAHISNPLAHFYAQTYPLITSHRLKKEEALAKMYYISNGLPLAGTQRANISQQPTPAPETQLSACTHLLGASSEMPEITQAKINWHQVV